MSLRADTAKPGVATDLRALYAQQLAERGFRADPVQAAIVCALSGPKQSSWFLANFDWAFIHKFSKDTFASSFVFPLIATTVRATYCVR